MNEVYITEDTESIDFGWFENTKLNRVDACRKWASVIGSHLARLRQEFKKGRKDHQWRNESQNTSRPRSSHRISILTSMNLFGQIRILSLLQFSVTVR